MNYWDVLKEMEKTGRVCLRTELAGEQPGRKTLLQKLPGECPDAFCECLQHPPRLFVFGGGHVGSALARMAAFTDFKVFVVEPRPEFGDSARFPEAVTVLQTGYEEVFEEMAFLPSDYLAVMTPGHQKDANCTLKACQVQVAYRGMMGSRAKVAITQDKLRKAGIPEAVIDSLHAPIGLDIKAQTPAEIAVAILAEIIQIYRQNPASTLEPEIVSALKALEAAFILPSVMCTIVEKHGSGPREVGTRMLASPGGGLLAGTIGGGEVEAHVLRRAGMMLEKREDFALETYHLSSEAAASIGMVCGGSCKVMFERLLPPAP